MPVPSRMGVCLQVCEAMGCSAGFASAPVTGKQLQGVAIQGSLSLALGIGQAVQQAHSTKTDPVAAAATAGKGRVVFKGMAHYLPIPF